MNYKEKAVHMLLEGATQEEVIQFLFAKLDQGEMKKSKSLKNFNGFLKTISQFVNKMRKRGVRKGSESTEKPSTSNNFTMKVRDFKINPNKRGHEAEAKFGETIIYISSTNLEQLHRKIINFYFDMEKYIGHPIKDE